MYKIYSLNDPNTKEIRYIGYTSQSLESRLKQHVRDSNRNGKSYKRNWIKSLKTNPTIELIEDKIENKDKILELERYYISKYENLTNGTNGGEKNKTFTNDVKNRISESLKEKYKNGEIVPWNKGKKIGNKCKSKKKIDVGGEKNPFYGKKHSEKTKKLIGDKNRKHRQYSYNEIYDMYIKQNMKQKEISEKLNLTRPYVCLLMKKFDLVKIKKKIKTL